MKNLFFTMSTIAFYIRFYEMGYRGKAFIFTLLANFMLEFLLKVVNRIK